MEILHDIGLLPADGPITIGIFGSAKNYSEKAAAMAKAIGAGLGRGGCKVITGACSGLPYLGARAAAGAGAEVWGFSPVMNLEEQKRFVPEDDLSIYAKLIFVPESFPFAGDLERCKKYRNLISTAHCHAGIIIAGELGTLNEATNLLDFGAVVGVLEGSGGIADRLAGLVEMIGRGKAVFGRDPELLVERVMGAISR